MGNLCQFLYFTILLIGACNDNFPPPILLRMDEMLIYCGLWVIWNQNTQHRETNRWKLATIISIIGFLSMIFVLFLSWYESSTCNDKGGNGAYNEATKYNLVFTIMYCNFLNMLQRMYMGKAPHYQTICITCVSNLMLFVLFSVLLNCCVYWKQHEVWTVLRHFTNICSIYWVMVPYLYETEEEPYSDETEEELCSDETEEELCSDETEEEL
eukprot:64925_1